jgi:hypothetical protein
MQNAAIANMIKWGRYLISWRVYVGLPDPAPKNKKFLSYA